MIRFRVRPAAWRRAALGSLLLLACRTGFPQPPMAPPALPAFADQRTDDLKRTALDLLNRGRRMDLAVAQLEEVVRRDPEDLDDRTHLGCALAGRAFTLARYLDAERSFAGNQRGYTIYARRWHDAQEAQDSPLKGIAFTAPPVALPEMLDGSAVKMSDPQITAAMEELTRRAEQYLGVDVDHPAKEPEDTTAFTAEQLDIRAWSELLLRIGPLTHITPKADEVKIVLAAMAANLTAAMKKDNTPRRKQSAGDALVLSCHYPHFGTSVRRYKFDESTLDEGLRLLTEVAGKAPRDRDALWFFIGCNQPQSRLPDAIAAFKQAAHYNTSNAIYPYTCASAIALTGKYPDYTEYTQTLLEEVHSYLSSGSSCTSIQPVHYPIAAPAAVRWAFRDLLIGDIFQVVGIDIVLEVEVGREIKAKDSSAACKTADEAAQIGLLYFRSASATQDSSDAESMSCYNSGHLAMAIAAGMVGEIKAASLDKGVTSSLDYCLAFAPTSEDRPKADGNH